MVVRDGGALPVGRTHRTRTHNSPPLSRINQMASKTRFGTLDRRSRTHRAGRASAGTSRGSGGPRLHRSCRRTPARRTRSPPRCRARPPVAWLVTSRAFDLAQSGRSHNGAAAKNAPTPPPATPAEHNLNARYTSPVLGRRTPPRASAHSHAHLEGIKWIHKSEKRRSALHLPFAPAPPPEVAGAGTKRLTLYGK